MALKVTSTVESVAANSVDFNLKLRTVEGNTIRDYIVCDAENTQVDIKKKLALSVLSGASIDTDKFLVSDDGIVKYRSGAQVLSDIGAAAVPNGNENKLSKFISSSTIGDSSITDTGSLVTIPTKTNITKDLTTTGRFLSVTIKDDSYTAEDDDVIVCDKSSALTITLPEATGSGRRYIIKNINTGIVTVDGDGSDTIDGETTQALSQWSSMQVVDYAANKWVIV